MNHFKFSIILLSTILLLSLLLFSDIEIMENQVVTVIQLSKLNHILTNVRVDNSDAIVKYIRGLKLSNPYFTKILKDRYLSDHGKCIFLKEITDFVISNSVTYDDTLKNIFRQAVISNNEEEIKDNLIINTATVINDILSGTTPENANESIAAINKMHSELEGTVIKSIIDISELSSYNKVLILKQIVRSIIVNSNVKSDNMGNTWNQNLGDSPKKRVPTITPTSQVFPLVEKVDMVKM